MVRNDRNPFRVVSDHEKATMEAQFLGTHGLQGAAID
jgi:hypothetical protein